MPVADPQQPPRLPRPPRLAARTLVAVLAAALPGCEAEDPQQQDDGSESEAEPTPRVTYFDDALPILNEHCNGCHNAGGLAPFVLDDFVEASMWGPAVAAAAASRTMPPFAVDNSGACNTYAHARWLEDEEIDVLAAWVDDGLLEGEPPATPLQPPVPPVLGGPGIEEVRTPEYVPVPQTTLGQEFDDYQCFLLPTGLDRERFIVGFEVIPGNTATVHHVLGFKVNPTSFDNAEVMQALDDASPDQLGWDCDGAAGEGVLVQSVPVNYAPGVGAVEFPSGTGIPMSPEDVLVVQIHYNLLNDSSADSTAIRIKYADQVARPAIQALWDSFLFSSVLGAPASLPPGLERATYDWSATIATATSFRGDGDAVATGPVEIWGFAPHMHKRGRKMTIEIERADGERLCGTQVDRYDFNWQQMYFFEQPLHVDFGDTLRVRCEWDTRGDTAPVTPGYGTANEMCLVGLYAVPE